MAVAGRKNGEKIKENGREEKRAMASRAARKEESVKMPLLGARKERNGKIEEKIAMGCGTERKEESIKRLGKRICEKERANPVKRLLYEK